MLSIVAGWAGDMVNVMYTWICTGDLISFSWHNGPKVFLYGQYWTQNKTVFFQTSHVVFWQEAKMEKSCQFVVLFRYVEIVRKKRCDSVIFCTIWVQSDGQLIVFPILFKKIFGKLDRLPLGVVVVCPVLFCLQPQHPTAGLEKTVLNNGHYQVLPTNYKPFANNVLGRHGYIATWNYELDSACFFMRMI